MHFQNKQDELEFHYQRAREATARMIRSIVNNPSLAPEQQIVLLRSLSIKHRNISEFIESTITAGIEQGVVELQKLAAS